jgi:hypothetical protein
MATTINLKRILDRKQWEMLNLCPSGTSTGSFATISTLRDQWLYFITTNTNHLIYDPAEDAWSFLPSAAMSGTFGAGSCGEFHSMRGQLDQATGGTATTVNTTITTTRSMAGYKLRIVSGPGAGDEREILSNTVGTNAIFTVTSAFSATPTVLTFVQFITGSLYFWNAGTMSVGTFRRYDPLTNTWTSLSVTGAPASWGTEGKLVATRSTDALLVSSVATGGGANSLDDTTRSWGVNQFINFQVRIVSGTGAGQIRTISANTATQLTVGAAWTVNPDVTSNYAIEGNDSFLYLTGNNATVFYRYNIATNAWSTLAARGGAPGAGMGANWISSHPSWSDQSAFLNGRRIYSFRGAGGAVLEYYDIPSNTWTTVTYSPSTEVFSTGSTHTDCNGIIYSHRDNSGRWLRFDPNTQVMGPWSYNWYGQSTAHQGDRAVVIRYTDGATSLNWIAFPGNNQQIWHRCLIF